MAHPLSLRSAATVVAWASLLPSSAFAHAEGAGTGLMAGLLHPVTGFDHLLAMLAVGIVSVRLGGANIWRVPLAFVSAMALGAWLGFEGWPMPLAEAGIAGSVLLLGLAIAWTRIDRHAGAVFLAVAVFGLCHGYGHGAELPKSALPLFYSMGFLISTVFVHVIGIFIGELASSTRWQAVALRAGGGATALAGLWFVAQALNR